MEILWFTPRGANAAIPHPCARPPTNGPLHPLEGLSYILLHPSPIGRLRLLDFAVQAGSSGLGPRRVRLVLSSFKEGLQWLQRRAP